MRKYEVLMIETRTVRYEVSAYDLGNAKFKAYAGDGVELENDCSERYIEEIELVEGGSI